MPLESLSYVFILFGVIFGGELFIAPTIFIATSTDSLIFSHTMLIILLGVSIADSAWYSAGRFVGKKDIFQYRFFHKRKEIIDTLFAFFEHHVYAILLGTKFVFGTRVLSQITAGFRKVPYVKYISVSIVGTALWAGALALISGALHEALGPLMEEPYGLGIAFLLFTAVVVSIYYGIRHLAKRLMRR